MSEGAIERVGIGTDIHRLEPGEGLRLGGVDIPFHHRLVGYSDGDVLLHALTDALLGAAGLPDIGERFPNTDERYRGCDSAIFVREALQEIAARGYRVANIDVVVHAERPKLSQYKAAICRRLGELVGLSADRIAVKAKTNEGLDAVGRGEAIACTAVVGLARESRPG